MKHIISILLSLILITSCTKDEGGEIDVPTPVEEKTEVVRYYVKYYVSTEYTQATGTYIDHKGNTIHFTGNGEYVIGPVEKGFKAKVVLSGVNRSTLCNIYVSMYDEPFALRASKSSYGEAIVLEYTVE